MRTEAAILKNLIQNEEYTRKVLPFLKQDYFTENADKNLFSTVHEFVNKYNSLPIILNAANEIFVDQFLKKKISFYSIIYNLFKLLKDPKIRKYAIKKSTNLNSIISIDKWARDQATKILEKK